MKGKSESEVAWSCPTLATPWTAAYQAPPSTGFQAKVLEWGAIAFSNENLGSYKSLKQMGETILFVVNHQIWKQFKCPSTNE